MFKKLFASQTNLSTDALGIILTGPFQTGNPLDFSQKETNEYREIQEAVKDKMGEVFPHYMWKIPKSGEGQKYEMGAGGTGKAHSPPYYLECIMDCKKIKCNLKKYNFTIKKMQIKFYEFGFATVSIFGTISLKGSSKKNTKVSSDDLLCIVDDLDEKILKGEEEKIWSLISNITKKFIKTIRENKIRDIFANDKASDEETNISIGNIRSLHRIFQYKVNKNSEIKVAQEALDKIAKLSNGEWQEENSFSHFIGRANSAVVYNSDIANNCKNIDGKIFNQYKKAYETVLETANAYYFIAEFLKNGLSDYSRAAVAMKKAKKIRKKSGFLKVVCRSIVVLKNIFKNRKIINKAETGLNKFIILTSNFLSVFDEFVINLNPQGQNIWEKIDKIWNTSKTTEMLRDQLQSSLLITDRILKQASNKLQFWVRNASTIFAAIGLLSLVEISQSDGFDWEFYFDFWNFEIGEWVSNPINLFGSILAVGFVIAFILGIIGLLFWLRDWFIARRSRNNN